MPSPDKRSQTLLISLLGASCSFSWLMKSHAETKQNSALDTIIVTASSEKAIVQLPFELETLTRSELHQKQARTIPEALRVLPGVQIQKTANGHGSPFIRGFTGNRTLALIDGIRYNNSTYRDGANEYFAHIDVHSIENIELLRGPASVFYGSEAVGGAINLQTKSAIREADDYYFSPSTSVRFGTGEDSQSYRLSSNFGYKYTWGINAGITSKSYGNVRAADIGVLPNTGYDEISADVRFDYLLHSGWSLTGLHQSFSQDDVWRTHSTLSNIPFEGTQSGTDIVRLKDQKRSLSYIRLSNEQSLSFFDAASLTLSYQPRKDTELRVQSDGLHIDQGFTSNTLGADLKFYKSVNFGQFSIGISQYIDNIDSWRFDTPANSELTTQRIQGPVGDNATHNQFGAFTQFESDLTERLSLILSGRFSSLSADVDQFEDPNSGLPTNLNQNWDDLSFGIRSSYALTTQGDQFIWASLSESFRAPNIADLTRFGRSRSTEFEVASPDLDPEQFVTLEWGWKLSNQSQQAGVTWYYTDIKDYIQTAPTGKIVEGLDEVSKQNLAEGYVQGIDVSYSRSITPSTRAHLSASWLEAELSLPTQPDTFEPFSRMMPPFVRMGLDWRSTTLPLEIGSDIRIVGHANRLSSGDKSDTQRIPAGGTPSYALWDAFVSYDLSEKHKLNFTLENITNQAYRVHGSGTNEVGFNAIISLTSTY